MRVAVLDVTPLVTVRETFRPTWRITTALVFLALVGVAWGAIHGTPDARALLADPRPRASTLFLLLPLAVGLCAALPRKTIRAQLLFTTIAAFNGIAVLGVVGATILASTPGRDALGMAIGGLVVSWIFWGRYVVASLQSLVPLRRWQPHHLRLALCRDLWSGAWRGADTPPGRDEGSDPYRPVRSPHLRFAWGLVALAWGLGCGALLMILSVNTPLHLALYRLQFRDAVSIVRTGIVGQSWELPTWHPANAVLLALMLLAFLGLRSFAASREHWRRRNVPVRRSGMRMTTTSVLLLRSFHEEENGVPPDVRMIRSVSRMVYGRGYTFVDLIVERLAVVGPVKLFGWEGNLPPPRSGDRYFTDRWEDEIERVVPLARMIVVLFGTTQSLAWELNAVRDGGFLSKTVFLMPADWYPPRARRRWTALADFLCPDPERRRVLAKAVKPQRVLAACVQEDLLLVFTGKQEQPAYESALDLAAVLTLAGPGAMDGMVTKYVDSAAPRFPWSRVPAGVSGA